MKIKAWADFKAFVDDRSLSIQWLDADGHYYMLAVDGPFALHHTMYKDGGADQTEFEASYKAAGNKTIEPKDANGINLTAIDKPSGQNFKAEVSHDFTDKTTWFGGSTRVTGETLTAAGLVYSGANTNWIDLEHGLVPREDEIADTYKPVVYDNGTEVTSGITFDYAAGTVTFDSAPTGPVTADYSYAGGSTWSLIPAAGKVISMEHAELDFTVDVVMPTVHFEIAAYNPADLPNKVVVERVTYKGFKDVLKIANQVEVVPALSGIGKDILRAVFDYGSTIDLKSSLGMELRIRVENDDAMTGEFGSITLYTKTMDE